MECELLDCHAVTSPYKPAEWPILKNRGAESNRNPPGNTKQIPYRGRHYLKVCSKRLGISNLHLARANRTTSWRAKAPATSAANHPPPDSCDRRLQPVACRDF